MPFNARIGLTKQLIDITTKHLWNTQPANRILVVQTGYENFMPDPIKQKLIAMRNQTAKYIRFAPDYLIIDEQTRTDPNRESLIYFLDYKVTRTPIYLNSRVAFIANKANMPGLTSQDISQMETDAYENYMALSRMGVRVVVLDYCAYHPRLLLCDFVENIRVLHQDQVTTDTESGSRTPFTNFYCPSMRTLPEFMAQVHRISLNQSSYNAFYAELQKEIAPPTTHRFKSPDQL